MSNVTKSSGPRTKSTLVVKQNNSTGGGVKTGTHSAPSPAPRVPQAPHAKSGNGSKSSSRG